MHCRSLLVVATMSFPSRTLAASLLTLTLVGTARPQQPEPAADAQTQRLLADLGDVERSVDAIRTLTRRGAPAVTALMAAIRDPAFRSDEQRLATAVYALGKFGDVAAPAAQLVIDELLTASGDCLRNLYWALGELGPRAEADGAGMLTGLRKLKPAPGWAHQEWAFACRRIEVGTEPGPDELARLLQATEHASMVAAAGVLLRRRPGSDPVPQQELLAAWQRCYKSWQRDGESAARVTFELARAVVRHAPGTPAAEVARTVLVRHFDVEVRLEAVMQLGLAPASDPALAVRALQDSLGDGSVLVRREAVTALGLLGPAAEVAAPALAALAGDADAQIRARAAAALRAIRRATK